MKKNGNGNGNGNGHKTESELPDTIAEADVQKMESFRLKIENAQLKIMALQNEGKQLQEQNITFLREIQAKYKMTDGDKYDSQTGKITRENPPAPAPKPRLVEEPSESQN